jgi:hypothetical protein
MAWLTVLLTTGCLVGATGVVSARADAATLPDPAIDIVVDNIGGVMNSAKGTETGVGVIAATRDLQKHYYAAGNEAIERAAGKPKDMYSLDRRPLNALRSYR